MKRFIYILAAAQLMALGSAMSTSAQGGDLLNEVPIWPVPAQMTLEEYTDAHRRLGVGRVLMSVPFPGALHFYAGESRAGWKHVGAAALGTVSLVVGAAMIDEKDNAWQKTDLEIVDITGSRGKVERYEKVPVEEENGVVTYQLREVPRKTKGGGGALIALGAGLIVGQLIHDWIGGVHTIERKRDAVRYKYGKSAGYRASVEPTMDLERRQLGAALALRF